MHHSHTPLHSKFFIRCGLLLATTLIGFPAAVDAQPAPAQPTPGRRGGAAPSTADLTVLNKTLQTLIEQDDPTTKDIFDKNPNYRMLRAPMPVLAAAPAAPVATIARDAGPWTPNNFTKVNPALPSLIVAGDSTAQTGDPAHRGWAALLVDYFDPAKINLVNPSIGGRSFRSFTYEGRWDSIVANLKPGDIVMIQFGHNDGNGNDINNANGRPELGGIGEETQDVTHPDGKVETVHTFGWYARKFIADTRAKGATPIMMTTTVYNRWNADGSFARGGSNVNFARQVAEQEKVLLLDDTNIISDKYNQLGKAVASPLFGDGILHTNTAGAVINAEMFISGMKALGIKPVVDALNEKGQAIPAYQPAETKPAAPAN